MLDELMERHLAKVRSVVFRMVLDEAVADDLTQDVFLKVFRNLDSFRGESQFATWLYRVALNVAHDFLRSAGRLRVEYHAEFHGELPQPESRDAKPEQAVLRSELLGEIERALSGLSPALRAAMVLTVLEQLSPAEAATIEDCTVDTMYSRIHAARKQLKQSLKHYLSWSFVWQKLNCHGRSTGGQHTPFEQCVFVLLLFIGTVLL